MRFKQEGDVSLIVALTDPIVNRAMHPLNAAPLARARLSNAENAREIACLFAVFLQLDNAKTQ